MSTHRVNVIRIQDIEPHPNADSLGIVRIGGYACCVKLGDFKAGDLAVYIEPDYEVPDTSEWGWLYKAQKSGRIKVRRLRGVYSQGLLVPAPEGCAEGDNVLELLGIKRYEPKIVAGTSATPDRGPWAPHYDLENWQRYPNIFQPDEMVYVTEKIHGCNAKYVWWEEEDRFLAGSRTQWVKDGGNVYWEAARRYPWIEVWCRSHPNDILFGEIFGWVQDLRYGHDQGSIDFAAFDIFRKEQWVDSLDIWGSREALVHMVPFVKHCTYREALNEAEGESLIANHLREGVVIKPLRERFDPTIGGRAAVKAVSNAYLER